MTDMHPHFCDCDSCINGISTGAIILFAALAVGCSGSVEPTLPPTCSVQPEHVREQLCPRHESAVVCQSTGQTNFDPARCAGPDYTDGHQVTGNAWCCDLSPACDPGWKRCVAAGLAVECVSNGAESLCTCQGTLDGRLTALVCRP